MRGAAFIAFRGNRIATATRRCPHKLHQTLPGCSPVQAGSDTALIRRPSGGRARPSDGEGYWQSSSSRTRNPPAGRPGTVTLSRQRPEPAPSTTRTTLQESRLLHRSSCSSLGLGEALVGHADDRARWRPAEPLAECVHELGDRQGRASRQAGLASGALSTRASGRGSSPPVLRRGLLTFVLPARSHRSVSWAIVASR